MEGIFQDFTTLKYVASMCINPHQGNEKYGRPFLKLHELILGDINTHKGLPRK